MTIENKMELKFKEFCNQYGYDEDPSNNVYSIYDFTDFIQLNLDDDRIDYLRYFIDMVSKRDDLIFRGNLHEISVLSDDETTEFIGNLVHFYHGDNFCESFYAIVYFDEYPNFFQNTETIEHNAELEVKGKLRLNKEEDQDFYFLEFHDVKYIEKDGQSIID